MAQICNVCGKSAKEGEEFTYLPLYINGSEGTTACEDCKMDITNFTRNLSSTINRTRRDLMKLRHTKEEIGFGMSLGAPFKRPHKGEGGLEGGLINFHAVARAVGLPADAGAINANGMVMMPEAVKNAVLKTGKISTSLGEEFEWNEESEVWDEVAAGHPRELRQFEAGPMGFPEEDLGWSWKPEAIETGHISLNNDRLIFAGTLKEPTE